MLSEDGQTSTAFGLNFRQHDNRQMQQILKAYNRLPENPTVRTAVYLNLVFLERDLEEEEAQGIRDWLKGGGVLSEFPALPVIVQEKEEEENGVELEIMGGVGGHRDGEFVSESEDEDEDEDEVMEDEHEHSGEDEEKENNDANGKLPAIEEKECCICASFYALSYFPSSTNITSRCNHGHDEIACLHCIQETIRSAIKDGDLYRITCPLCPENLSHEEVKTFASKEMFNRYEYLVMMATPGLVMCLGSNCGSGQVHEDSDSEPIMICNACGFKTCVVHKLPWHEGFTCEEFDRDETQIERLEADEATAKLLSQNSKVCPTCKQGVTKQDGCNHLHCRCGEEWCFICLASWENIIRIGPTAHARTCDYHPDKVRIRADQREANETMMQELVHGGAVSETLERARRERNARRRDELRPLAAEAAERRMKAMEESRTEASRGNPVPVKRRVKLSAPWEER